MIEFSDAEYSLIVLQCFKRLASRTDYYQGFVQPRDITRSNPDRAQVVNALEYAIAVVTAQVGSERVSKALHKSSWSEE